MPMPQVQKRKSLQPLNYAEPRIIAETFKRQLRLNLWQGFGLAVCLLGLLGAFFIGLMMAMARR
jgi:hypothetical protein